MKRIKKWSLIIIGVLLVIAILRYFICSIFLIPSNGMANALIKGDRVLVSKSSYGWNIPLVRGKIFANIPNKRDIVFFENPLATPTKLLSTETYVGEVTALPGDSLVLNDAFTIHNLQIKNPETKSLYLIAKSNVDEIDSISIIFNIQGTTIKEDSTHIFRTYNNYEAYLISDIDSELMLKIADQEDATQKSTIVIPSKNEITTITPWNISLVYNAILLHENESNLEFKEGQIRINGKPITSYQFKQNYYWITVYDSNLMADSSRYGLVPENNLIGKASLIVYSKDTGTPFYKGYKSDRLFKKIR